MSKRLFANNFTHLNDVFVGEGLVRLIVLGVLEQHLVHVGAGVLEQLVVGVEDDDGDLAVAEDAQLVRFLHQTELPLGERHLTIPLVRDSLDGYFLSTHDDFFSCMCLFSRFWSLFC